MSVAAYLGFKPEAKAQAKPDLADDFEAFMRQLAPGGSG